MTLGCWQQVPDLSVGVVDHRVEHGHRSQPGVPAVPGEGDQVHRGVGVDPELAHAGAERAVPVHGRRDDVPARDAGDLVGGELAACQRAVREVPERPLPRDRFVDARRFAALVGDDAVQVALDASASPPAISSSPAVSSSMSGSADLGARSHGLSVRGRARRTRPLVRASDEPPRGRSALARARASGAAARPLNRGQPGVRSGGGRHDRTRRGAGRIAGRAGGRPR